MDQLLHKSLLEIALEGLKGCTLQQLFKRLNLYCTDNFDDDDNTDKPIQLKLWQMLKECHGREITFYTQSSPPPSSSSTAKYEYTNHGYIDYSVQSNRSKVVNLQEQLSLVPNDSTIIVMVANSEMRSHILGIGYRTDVTVTEMQYCILEYLGQNRDGVFQSQLSAIHMDPKTSAYHLQRLNSLGLVYKQSKFDPNFKHNANFYQLSGLKTISSTTTTTSSSETSEQMEERLLFEEFSRIRRTLVTDIVQLLENAKDNILVEMDVRRRVFKSVSDRASSSMLKHKWDRFKMDIQQSNRIEFFFAIVDRRTTRCLRLIQNSAAFSETTEMSNQFDIQSESDGFYVELPQLTQVYEMIANTGNDGIPHPSIYTPLQMDAKQSQALVNEAKSTYNLRAVAEKAGKQTQYRYFAVNPEKVLLTNRLLDLNETTPITTMTTTTTTTTTATVEEPTTQRTPEKKVIQVSTEPYTSSVKKKKSSVITTQMAQRCQLIVDYLKEKHIATKLQIRQLLKEKLIEDQSSTTSDQQKNKKKKSPFLDNKTVTRAVETLEKEQKIRTFFVHVPALFGTQNKEHTCIIRADLPLDDPIIAQFTQKLRDEEVTVRKKGLPFDKSTLEEVTVTRLTTQQQPQPEQQPEPLEQQSQLEQPKSSQSLPPTRTNYHESVYNSIKNGYINAKMLRAKNFHLFLFKLYEQTKQNQFRLSEIVGQMPLILFLKIVGSFVDLDVDKSEYTVPIKELSLELKKRIFARGNTKSICASRVEGFVNLLSKLNLIISSTTTTTSEFTLNLIPDHIDNDLEKRYHFKSMDDVVDYWDDLESYSSNEFQHKNPIVKNVSSDLHKSNWSEVKHLTLKQIRALEEYYKQLNGRLPTVDECRKIAVQVKSSYDKVVCYYLKNRTKVLNQRLSRVENFEASKVLFHTTRSSRQRKDTTKRKLIESAKSTPSINNNNNNKNNNRNKQMESTMMANIFWENEQEQENQQEGDDDNELRDLEELVSSDYSSEEEDSDDSDNDLQTVEQQQQQQQQPQSLSQYANKKFRILSDRKTKKGVSIQQKSTTPTTTTTTTTTTPEKPTKRPSHANAFVKQQKQKKLEREKKEEEKKRQPRRITYKKIKWKPEEDLFLLESIANHRQIDSNGHLLQQPVNWVSIAESVPNRNADQCRRRWQSVLRLLPWCRKAVELACAHRQLSTPSILVQSTTTTANTTNTTSNTTSNTTTTNTTNATSNNLRSLLIQCRDEHATGGDGKRTEQAMFTTGLIEDVKPLPSTIDQFYNQFTILRIFEEEVEKLRTSYTLKDELIPNVHDLSYYHMRNEQSSLRVAALTDLFRIILLTPNDDYSHNAAYNLVKKFTPNEMERAITLLKNKKVISRNKEKLFRMKGYKLSQLFYERCLASHFPVETFIDAQMMKLNLFTPPQQQQQLDDDDDEEELKQPIRTETVTGEEHLMFNSLCTGGEVAAVFNLLTDEKIDIIPELSKNWSAINELYTMNEHSEDLYKGVSHHLMRVGAIRNETDCISGLSISDRYSRHNFQLPDWNIRIVVNTNNNNNSSDDHKSSQVLDEEQQEQNQNLASSTITFEEMDEHNLDIDNDSGNSLRKKRRRTEIVSDLQTEQPNAKRLRLDTSTTITTETNEQQQHIIDEETKNAIILEYNIQDLDENSIESLVPFIVRQQQQQQIHNHHIDLMVDLYRFISSARDSGRDRSELKEYIHSYESLLNDLLTIELIVPVHDFERQVFVAKCFAKNYLLPKYTTKQQSLSQFKYDERQQSTPISPFMKLNGEMNSDFIYCLKQKITELLMRKPGLPEKYIVNELSVLNPSSVLSLIKEMEQDDKLIRSVEQMIPKVPVSQRNPILDFDQEDDDVFNIGAAEEEDQVVSTKCYYTTLDAVFY